MSSRVLKAALGGIVNTTPAILRAGPGCSSLSSLAGGAAFTLPPLPYAFGALEPAISGAIMELHHGKHHAAYVTNLTGALGRYRAAEAAGQIGDMIALQVRFVERARQYWRA